MITDSLVRAIAGYAAMETMLLVAEQLKAGRYDAAAIQREAENRTVEKLARLRDQVSASGRVVTNVGAVRGAGVSVEPSPRSSLDVVADQGMGRSEVGRADQCETSRIDAAGWSAPIKV